MTSKPKESTIPESGTWTQHVLAQGPHDTVRPSAILEDCHSSCSQLAYTALIHLGTEWDKPIMKPMMPPTAERGAMLAKCSWWTRFGCFAITYWNPSCNPFSLRNCQHIVFNIYSALPIRTPSGVWSISLGCRWHTLVKSWGSTPWARLSGRTSNDRHYGKLKRSL